MIDVARKDPLERQAAVMDLRNRVVKYEQDELLNTWGVSIAHEPVHVEGRQLKPPRVVYGGNKQDAPRGGAWNLMGKKFLRPGQPLASWAIVNFTNKRVEDVRVFGDALRKAMANVGMQSAEPIYADHREGPTPLAILQGAGKKAFAASGKKLPQLFVCILEANQPSLYEDIKRAGMDLPTPTASQCINARKANIGGPKPIADQYVANVAMKINIKIGGGNHTINPADLPGIDNATMLMGADVTHPPPGLGLDSIAASVATADASRVIYGHEVRLQRNPGRGQSQEIILSMKDMIKAHLQRWARRNANALPTSIIMFRDGVSEGQFAAAKQVEIKAIRDAIQEVKPGTIKLTYIVCGKRHHVRFSAEDPGPGKTDARSGNLLAGTVVDTGVTNPVAFEFFLQAHAGLIGTAKPTRYIVLEDDNKFSSDSLQTVVNALCYSYGRATRSVSLPPPAYYSDILAEKARALLWADADTRSLVTGSSASGESRPFDPVDERKARELMTRIDKRTDFNLAQWYM
ncbi:Protein argonaute [Tilletia horrida]|uniref:Protein argonaute n=1 Tax=Tilletia horrida TaxID=155126 RepID=A0AAN6JGG1_9BASI|nr:Protein argonaute [Tilletia horrida]